MLVIFDCDGVLVDSEIIASQGLAELLTRYGHPITAEECIRNFTGSTIPGIIQKVRDQGADLPADFYQILRSHNTDAFENELRPVAGIKHALERLSDVPKCVASSGPPEKISGNLTITKLITFLDPYLFSVNQVKEPKPAPDLFYFAANRMGVDPSVCTVIEDSPVGVLGAKRAGMRVFGFIGASHRTKDDVDGLKSAGADLVFEDMTELPHLL